MSLTLLKFLVSGCYEWFHKYWHSTTVLICSSSGKWPLLRILPAAKHLSGKQVQTLPVSISLYFVKLKDLQSPLNVNKLQAKINNNFIFLGCGPTDYRRIIWRLQECLHSLVWKIHISCVYSKNIILSEIDKMENNVLSWENETFFHWVFCNFQSLC